MLQAFFFITTDALDLHSPLRLGWKILIGRTWSSSNFLLFLPSSSPWSARSSVLSASSSIAILLPSLSLSSTYSSLLLCCRISRRSSHKIWFTNNYVIGGALSLTLHHAYCA
jgi:hypothetical protein